MNNIEIRQLKLDVQKYFKYDDNILKKIDFFDENKVRILKNSIAKMEEKERIEKSTKGMVENKLLKKKVTEIFEKKPELKENTLVVKASVVKGKGIGKTAKTAKTAKTVGSRGVSVSKYDGEQQFVYKQKEIEKIKIQNRKPTILFITDVKEWAWWIKSEYIKKYLSDEFDISIDYVIGDGCTPANEIYKKKFDLFFTYGFSYISFLNKIHKNKKITGITAHRRKHVIFPKMKQAGHVHANSKMLLAELHGMGFKNAYYIPNGVDEKLFKPIKPIKKYGELIVGHVGKECPVKGQREFILPAIQSTGVKSHTNMKTWKDKIPHTEMPKVYSEMDVFMVASVEDGTPNPALEAAACGRPIISNAIGNMPEFIKDGYNGFIVPRKIGAYVDKINYFKENRKELIRMGKNARKTILESWTWQIQSENYRNMFRNIFEMEKK